MTRRPFNHWKTFGVVDPTRPRAMHGIPAQVPGPAHLCRALRRCRRLARRLDPLVPDQAVSAELVARLCAAPWAAGPIERVEPLPAADYFRAGGDTWYLPPRGRGSRTAGPCPTGAA